MKSTYSIKETKTSLHFTYSGDLEDVIEKAKKDLQREKENKDIEYWKWLYNKAKNAIETHNKRIYKLERFIACAENKLKKQESEGA